MQVPDTSLVLLVVAGGLAMAYVLLSAIGRSAVAVASELIAQRRVDEARRHEADAEAEAAGRAAALEPLAVNADGTLEEPILGIVERAV